MYHVKNGISLRLMNERILRYQFLLQLISIVTFATQYLIWDPIDTVIKVELTGGLGSVDRYC